MTHFSSAEHAALRSTESAAVTLTDAERQPCEVWTRVMGYHRPVASFNVGKQGEHRERQFFREPGCGTRCGA
jgi:anaerobic ribonucleoside-triphosphate reductase